MPLFPPLINSKGKSKEILNEITSKQIIRETTEIFKNNDKLLNLWVYSVKNTSVKLINNFNVYYNILIYD